MMGIRVTTMILGKRVRFYEILCSFKIFALSYFSCPLSGRSSQAVHLSKDDNLKDGPNKVESDPKDVLNKDHCVNEGSLEKDGKRVLPKKDLEDEHNARR